MVGHVGPVEVTYKLLMNTYLVQSIIFDALASKLVS